MRGPSSNSRRSGPMRATLGLRYREAVGQRARCGWATRREHFTSRGTGVSNLALRDVGPLVRQLRARLPGDPGAPALLMDYAAGRGLDRHGTIQHRRARAPLQQQIRICSRHLRGAGLMGLDMLPPLPPFRGQTRCSARLALKAKSTVRGRGDIDGRYAGGPRSPLRGQLPVVVRENPAFRSVIFRLIDSGTIG